MLEYLACEGGAKRYVLPTLWWRGARAATTPHKTVLARPINMGWIIIVLLNSFRFALRAVSSSCFFFAVVSCAAVCLLTLLVVACRTLDFHTPAKSTNSHAMP